MYSLFNLNTRVDYFRGLSLDYGPKVHERLVFSHLIIIDCYALKTDEKLIK
ncbi:hypothetical protein PHOSAC3_140181 [Mesotoga infera]|nr:hypothetical protein PHOSAC3_140181 [Mesotoga infera]